MNVKSKSSSFQSVILRLIREELNMMLCETFQLKKKNICFSDYERLTKIILKEIANTHIVSPHLTPEKAQNYIKLLETMNCHHEIGNGFKRASGSVIGYNYREDANPYSDSPLY